MPAPQQGRRSSHEPAHPDHADTGEHHDRQGRSWHGPDVPPGRDSERDPVPSVPHEGLLGRIGTSVVAGQCVVLAGVAVAGFVVSRGAGLFEQTDTTVLALRLNPAHSTLLLLTAVAGAVAVLRGRALLRRFAADSARKT